MKELSLQTFKIHERFFKPPRNGRSAAFRMTSYWLLYRRYSMQKAEDQKYEQEKDDDECAESEFQHAADNREGGRDDCADEFEEEFDELHDGLLMEVKQIGILDAPPAHQSRQCIIVIAGGCPE
jgi:hypothetical protein